MVFRMSIPAWVHDLASALDDKLGMVIDEASPTRAVGRCPVAGNTQPFGLWHGGASCVVAESLASLAAAVEVGPRGSVAGVDINATHLRPAVSGWITGTATALRIGGTLATYDVALTDDEGRQVCAARVTVRLKRADGEQPDEG
jgi:uncharacterized protein (TIGR00369 family)